MDPDSLRYPIGKFQWAGAGAEERTRHIAAIEETAERLRDAVRGLSAAQFDTPYRPGGWTVRQVVHHLPDSHMNAYVRFRLALTEDEPLVKPYREELWAELPDARSAPVEVSLSLLEALHARWTALLGSLAPAQWERSFRHPEMGLVPLERNLAIYAWHGPHHVAQIAALRKRNGW